MNEFREEVEKRKEERKTGEGIDGMVHA